LGAAYVEKEALDQAISEFKRIPPESTLFADSRRNIFLLLKRQNKTGEGVRILEESVQAKPNDEDLYLLLAEVFEKENQSGKALATLRTGLEKIQNAEGIHFQIGALYDKMGEFDKMVAEMKEVLRINPNHADALNYLGYSYSDRGIQLEEALKLIQKAMELKPNMGYITDSLGWVYYKLGDYKRAVTELEKANQLTPDDSTITEHLADSYVKLSRIDKAIEFYEKALKLDPKSDQKERLQKKIQELKEKRSK
jgi:tetratricopeptide (TPR) repeat protein